jgi:hypothetical protein
VTLSIRNQLGGGGRSSVDGDVVIKGEALQGQHDKVTPTRVLCRVDVEGDGHQGPDVVDNGGMGVKANGVVGGGWGDGRGRTTPSRAAT